MNCADASATVRVEVIGTSSTTTSSLAYSSTGLTTLNYVILPIDGRGQVYDAANGLIHSITSATSSSYPQSIVSIDPTSGQVVASSPLSLAPWALTVSPDGQYLYILSSVQGSPVQRFKVAGLAPDLSIPIDSTEYAQGISVSPASPTTFAITGKADVGPLGLALSQLQIFDGTTPRPNSYVAPQLVSLLSPVWTGDAAQLVVPGGGLNTFAVDSQGVALTKTAPIGGAYDGRLYGSVFYDNNGSVIDLNGPVAQLGQIPDDSGSRAENPSINKTFAIDHDLFDVESLAPAGASSAPVAFAASISVAPNDANTIAVALNFHAGLCDSSDYGLAIYDGQTRRANVFTGTLSGPKSVVWGRDSSTLYEEDWDGIKALSVDSTGPGQATLLVPYPSLEGNTYIYDLHNNLHFDPAKSRILAGEGTIYDLISATALPKLPVTPVIDGNGCGIFGAITSDQQTGKVFYAELNTGTNSIVLHSFDSQTLKQIDQMIVPVPAGLPRIGGPTGLVRLANSNVVALVTSGGYIVTLQGPPFAP